MRGQIVEFSTKLEVEQKLQILEQILDKEALSWSTIMYQIIKIINSLTTKESLTKKELKAELPT
jgi:hypothetical protein